MGVCKREDGNGWRIYGYTGGNMVICGWLGLEWKIGLLVFVGTLDICICVFLSVHSFSWQVTICALTNSILYTIRTARLEQRQQSGGI